MAGELVLPHQESDVEGRLTQPEARSQSSHVDEKVNKGDVHQDVPEKHDKDVGRVGVLLSVTV